jgi:hypothetical protein
MKRKMNLKVSDGKVKAACLVAVVFFSLIVGAYFGVWYARSTPSTTPVFETPTDSFSYLVWVASGVYYAKSGLTGAIDYSSANASYVIQSSLDFGGTILLKNNAFFLDSALNFKVNATKLLGSGYANTKIRQNNAKNLPYVIAVENNVVDVEIAYLEIDGNRDGNTGTTTGIDVYSTNGLKNCHSFHHLWIHDMDGYGLTLNDNVIDSTVEHNLIEDCNQYGIRLAGSGNQENRIQYNHVQYIGTGYDAIFFYDGVHDCWIIGNEVNNARNGIYISNPVGSLSSRIDISRNNVHHSTTNDGILIWRATMLTIADNIIWEVTLGDGYSLVDVSYSTITGGVIKECGGQGIGINSNTIGTDRLTISNLQVWDCEINGLLSAGFEIMNSTRIYINNCVSTFNEYGISLDTNTDYCMISNCETGGNDASGIHIVTDGQNRVTNSWNETTWVTAYP